jgi:hypothetical protein
MPTFYWLGTALTESNKNSFDPYDWNYPGNWLVKLVSSSSRITVATTAPGAGDTVYIGIMPPVSDDYLPAGVSGTTMARSPLLFGGCSGMSPIGGAPGASGSNAIWLNASLTAQSGGTSNSDLIRFYAYLDEHPYYPDPTNENFDKYYDFPFYSFPFLGGGIGTLTPQGQEVTSYLADIRGCTAVYGNTVTHRQRDGLNLRVKTTLSVNTTGRIDLKYPVGGNYRNHQQVNINLVPSKSSTVSTTNSTACNKLTVGLNGNKLVSSTDLFVTGNVGANKRGSGDIAIRRYTSYTGSNYGEAIVLNRGGVPLIYNAVIDNENTQLYHDSDPLSGTWTLGLSAASSRALRATITDAMILNCTAIRVPGIVIDGCTMGTLNIADNWPLSETEYRNRSGTIAADPEAIVIASSFDGVQVKNALGFSGASAYAGMNTINIASAYGIETNTKTLKNPRLILGDQFLKEEDIPVLTDTIKVNNISFYTPVDPPISDSATEFIPTPWQLEFIGPASVTSVDADNCIIVANDYFQEAPTIFGRGVTGSGISINALTLVNASTLNLDSVPSFDDWFFGSYITGSTNNGFNGGINLGDQTAKIIGSRGVRLYNTKKVGTNYDARSGTYIP